jgi:peptidoglycan/xylan/chitin deacetylase (PgdA/CDA1 family)
MDDKYSWVGTVARRLGGAYLSSRLIPGDNVRVAMTHYVFDEDLEQFDRILRFLGSEREFIDPQRFFRHYDEDSPQPIVGKSLLWTFDDGFLSAYNAAQRVLNPLGVKAIFFIPTAILDFRTHEQMKKFAHARVLFGSRPLEALRPEEYITMGAEHLQELHEQGHMILPHTHSHVRACDITTPEDVVRELMRPKLILEDLLRAPAEAVAIPVGTPSTVSTYSYRQIASVYSVCFTALGGPNTDRTDPRFLRRDSIHPWYSAEHARNVVDGIFDPYFGMRMKALHRRAGGSYLPARRAPQTEGTPVASQAAGDARTRFVARVADAFERAGVEYVFLHGYGQDRGFDSDLDVAVARSSLKLTDELIRSGAFGRVVQCLHHGVPWCRYYAVEVDEPGRRYRQLDVVCDPWGIGPDGPAVPVALSSAVLSGGMRVPEPAAETLYLAVKRARKRRYGLRDQADLARVFRRDPKGAATLLGRHLGPAGAELAEALQRRRPDVTDELDALRKRVVRLRRSPATLARRVVLDPLRIVRRLLGPTGLAVCIVGADADCESLVAGLERETDGVFRRITLLRPGPRFLPSSVPPVVRTHAGGREPHRAPTSSAPGLFAWFAFFWLDTLARWPRVTLGRARASLVIVDQGWPDIAVNPRRYGIQLPLRVIRILGRALPQPDLTLFVGASSGSSRKPGVAESQRRLDAWRVLAGHDPDDFVAVGGSTSAETTLEIALEAIGDRLAARQHDLRAPSETGDPPEGLSKSDVVVSSGAGQLLPAEARHDRRGNPPMTGTTRKEGRLSG